MRIINFRAADGARLGVRVGEEVVDLAVAAPNLPRNLPELLAGGQAALKAAEGAAAAAPRDAFRPIAGLEYLPVCHAPGKVVCLGANYLAHVKEGYEFLKDDTEGDGVTAKEFPPVFLRVATSLVGHGQPILRPKASEQLDFECELAFVIGKSAKNASKDKALDYVAGYSCFNDGSIRDVQLRTSQWDLGKNFDKTGAFGPEFVTADELPPGASGLRIQTRLNGKVMQDSNTEAMIFGVASAIEILSQSMTLNPGDVVIMGTCEGVGLTRNPQVFMKAGDRCEIEIEGIGVLSNPIANE